MTQPYYDDGTCTIYHGDCRELLSLMNFDAIVTDPPYGIGLDTSGNRGGKNQIWKNAHPQIAGDDKPFDPTWLLTFDVPTILWGANHYASRLPDKSGWLCWDKATRDGFNLKQAELELAWTNCVPRPQMLRHLWVGYHRATEVRTSYHPAQKPVALLAWCINLLDEEVARCIADPFMGSGPTLRAAKDLGRKAIGIEIEERYCEIAAKRLAQEVLAFPGGEQ